MYADSTPVVAPAPSCTRRSWPPAPALREPIYVEADPSGDPAWPAPVPARRTHRPLKVRTYITADGVVRKTEEPPARRQVSAAPLAPRQDGPRIVRFAEEID